MAAVTINIVSGVFTIPLFLKVSTPAIAPPMKPKSGNNP